MSEPRIIKQLDPYQIEARVKARKEAEAARETIHLAGQPIEAFDLMPGPEDIPKVTKVPDPYEIEARIKARREAEAKREAVAQAAAEAKAIKEYDPMPGPEGIPKVFDADTGKEVPYLSLFPAYPEHHYGPAEEPLVFEEGDPRAATVGYPQIPSRDAELPLGYPGRLGSPSGRYAVSVLPSGAVQVTRYNGQPGL